MARNRTTAWLNRMRWVTDSAISQVFEEAQNLLLEYQKSPDLQADLADPATYAGPHIDIEPTDVADLAAAMGAIFGAIDDDMRATIYKFRATDQVPGR